jgi:hypothetical protein
MSCLELCAIKQTGVGSSEIRERVILRLRSVQVLRSNTDRIRSKLPAINLSLQERCTETSQQFRNLPLSRFDSFTLAASNKTATILSIKRSQV